MAMTTDLKSMETESTRKLRNGTIGVVIPGYGHPQFLSEAIISACTQDIDQPVQVVVVDDGCRFVETGKTVANLMKRFPGMLYYLRQENTRLPGARNTGIRFLMSMVPDLDAIYFLDADNRLSPYSLRNFREILGDDPVVGWAYPDISFMGMTWGEEGFDTRETAPVYSRLKHLLGNISEAGSLVRADVFRQGVFFDETMRYGFEDWDFWLSAIGAGFVGKRVQHAGFLYRRRPESMLADSRRQEYELISRMRRKHDTLFQPRNLMALEHSEAPYFAVVIAETGEAFLTSDPCEDGHYLTASEFAALAHRWQYDKREHFFPGSIIVLSDEQWCQLREQKQYLRWLFWAFKEAEKPFQRWIFESRPRPYHEGLPKDTPVMANSILIIKAEGFYELLRCDEIVSADTLPEFSSFVFQAPNALIHNQGKQAVASQEKRLLKLLEEARNRRLRVRHSSRRFAGPSAVRVRSALINDVCAEEGRQPFPVTTRVRRTLVAVDQETLENQARRDEFINVLTQLADVPGEVLLVLERSGSLDMDKVGKEAWWPLITDLIVLDRVYSSLEYRMYLGRRIYSLFTVKSKEDGAIIARSVDQLITIGATAFLEVFGDARQHGVKGYVYFTDVFMDSGPLTSQDTAKILAFEHAEERVVCDNPEMFAALAAEGFPPGKFVSQQDFFNLLKS
ncbi:MAG: glycosyltransferase family 2 protein [Oceanospirillaceae bacterium]|nr:glycosyltransferase family 2 protein [Oceanospirillaceae bacterium]